MLRAHSDVLHVPKLVVDSALTTNYGDKALIITPLGKPMQPHASGHVVNGSHIADLIEVVSCAHELGMVHCDIKPDNIYVSEDRRWQ